MEAKGCMENQKQADNDPDFELDNRKLVLIFFAFLAICGCFFIFGYILGLGREAAPEPVNYTDAIPGSSRIKDDSSGEAYNRINEIVSEPVLQPSAVIEPTYTGTAVTGSASVAPLETTNIVLPPETPVVSVPSISSDKPKTQPRETTNKTAGPTAGKTTPSVKQPASAKVTYSVQVAAFRVRSQAETTIMELKTKGFDSRIEPPTSDDYYRIKIGNFATRAEANSMVNRLQKSGFKPIITENKGN